MSGPPGPQSTTRPNLRANGERQVQFLSPRIVAREAVKILSARGVEVRPAQVRLLVTRFIESGHTTLAQLESWVISYADPTGETAVRRAMRSHP